MSGVAGKRADESMMAWLVRLFRHRLVKNVLTLSGVQIFNYVLPLMTLPFLVRVLGPSGWGIVAFYQALALFGAQFIEFGFRWSATREVARLRKDPEGLGRILADVLGGKALLCSSFALACLLLAAVLPRFGSDMLMLWLSLLWAFGQGANLVWFYHGLERMRFAATLSVSSKLVSTIGVFVFVRSPSDAWKVLALNAAGSVFAAAVGMLELRRWIPFVRPTLGTIWSSLRNSVTFFIFNSAVLLYTLANPVILAMFAPPRVVGYFAAASKISAALLLLLTPFSRALYPRVSYLASTARDRAAGLVRLEMKVLLAGAGMVSLTTIIFAPLVVDVVLGPGYQGAVPVLRLGALLPMLIAPSIVLGIHWMMSVGLERTYVKVVLMAAVLNFALAAVLAPRFGAVGMMSAVVINQLFVTVTITIWLWWRRLDPFRFGRSVAMDSGV